MTDISVAHRTSTEREDQHSAEQADKAAQLAERRARIVSRSRRVGAGVGAVIDLKEQDECRE